MSYDTKFLHLANKKRNDPFRVFKSSAVYPVLFQHLLSEFTCLLNCACFLGSFFLLIVTLRTFKYHISVLLISGVKEIV